MLRGGKFIAYKCQLYGAAITFSHQLLFNEGKTFVFGNNKTHLPKLALFYSGRNELLLAKVDISKLIQI